MPNKELTHDELKAIVAAKMDDPNTTAADILSTILTALQEPSAAMVLAASEQVRIKSMWRAMLAASALGEQSE
ncbi:hypothetical protein JQC79_10390 [Ochrobactrum anthropi]|uniref:hypothetical protein n=1 Tax=Brucella anthropi TaxID=529 RepID=UPI00194FD56E|nr:hypothetical protein [Brucella anthropi]MBM6396157.1 hypothetical protein [Brucella anthropi]